MLHPRLEADTFLIKQINLCQLRLMNDSRWPWLILVPEIAGAQEWHHLSQQEFEVVQTHLFKLSAILERVTACDKINIATLGNIVRQLHIHIIARREKDANWPGPIWGYGQPVPYETEEAARLIDRLKEVLG